MKKTNSSGAKSSFDFTVNKVPYRIEVSPFTFNDEKRFEIKVNGDDGHIFVWDPSVVGLRAIDDDSGALSPDLERAISERLVKTVVLV